MGKILSSPLYLDQWAAQPLIYSAHADKNLKLLLQPEFEMSPVQPDTVSAILMENLEKIRLARKTEPDPDCSDSLEPDPENRALGGPARMPTPGLELFQTKKKKYYRGVIASFSGVLTI